MQKQLTDFYSILSEFLRKSSIFLTIRIYKTQLHALHRRFFIAVCAKIYAAYFKPALGSLSQQRFFADIKGLEKTSSVGGKTEVVRADHFCRILVPRLRYPCLYRYPVFA